MPNEVHYQAELVSAFKKSGGYGKKLANQFSAHIPDLLLGLPNARHFPLILEVKVGDISDKTGKPINMNFPSPGQRVELEGMVRAGINAKWLMILREVRGRVKLLVCTDPRRKGIEQEELDGWAVTKGPHMGWVEALREALDRARA